MGLITVFDAILTGRQSGQKLQCLYGNLTANNFFQNRILQNLCQNYYAKILGRRFYSPSLKDVAWLERAQLIFLLFHTFVCKFGRIDRAAREKNYRQMYEKLEKIN